MLPLAISGEVFAAPEGNGFLTVSVGERKVAVFAKDDVPSEVPSGSPDGTDVDEERREKQKVVDDVNAFLIESYKVKLDKILAGVYRSVRNASNEDPELEAALLNRVLLEIRTKTQAIADRNISVNRKKILLAVFSYLESDI